MSTKLSASKSVSVLIPFLILAFVAMPFAGCQGGDSADALIAAGNDNNVKRLANLYAFFQTSHQFKGPADKAEFVEFIGSVEPDRLKRAGIEISDVDSLFVSERDGEEFSIRYGVAGRVRGPSIPVIFEKGGEEGKRRVGFTGSVMQEVDTAEWDRLWNMKPEDFKTTNERE